MVGVDHRCLARFGGEGVVFEAEGNGEAEVGSGAEAGESGVSSVEAEHLSVFGEVEEGVDAVVDGDGKGVFGGATVVH